VTLRVVLWTMSIAVSAPAASMSTPAVVVQAGLPVEVTGVSDDGAWRLQGGALGAQIVDVRTGLVVQTFTAVSSDVVALALSRDRRRLAVLTVKTQLAAAELVLFDVESGLVTMRRKETGDTLHFAANDTVVLVGSEGAVTRVIAIDAQEGVLRGACRGAVVALDAAAAFTRDGARTFRCDLKKGTSTSTPLPKKLAARSSPPAPAASRALSPLQPIRAALSPDGAWLATTAGQLWDLTLGKVHRQIPRGHDVAFVDDGSRVLVLQDEAAVVVEWATGRVVWRSQEPMASVSLARDRRRAAFMRGAPSTTIGNDHDGGELGPLLDVTTGTAFAPPVVWEKGWYPRRLALSPQGDRLAVGTIGLFTGVGATLVDVASGKPRPDPTLQTSIAMGELSFSAEGTWLAGAHRGTCPLVEKVDAAGVLGVDQASFSCHDGLVSTVAFSPTDDGLLVTGGTDGVVRFERLERNNGWRRFVRQRLRVSAVVQGLSFSGDGTRLAVATADGAVHLVDVARGAIIATFIGADDDFITVLPDGRYRASRGALQRVAFRVGLDVYPFDQFELRLHRPHDVIAALGRADQRTIALHRAAWRRRLDRTGTTDSDAAVVPPGVTVVAPPLQTAERSVRLEVAADGRGRALHRLDVTVNGVPVAGTAGLAVSPPGAKKATWTVPLVLSPGRNKVQVAAVTVDGVESLRSTWEIEGTFTRPPGRVWALGIGVGAHRELPLQFAVKDARDVLAALQPVAHTSRLLADHEVTTASLAEARRWLMDSDVDDTVVVFVAGHGVLDDRFDYWFGTTDIDFAAPQKAGIPFAAIEALVDGIPARRKLLLMDTCNSGELDPVEKARLIALGPAAKPTTPVGPGARGFVQSNPAFVDDTALAELMRELFADLRRGAGAVVLSSAGGLQVATEAAGLQNGIFTWALLDGVRSRRADKNGDGQTTTTELRDWVVPQVLELSRGAQRPTARREQVEFDFSWPQ
jgi:hypothetical protein